MKIDCSIIPSQKCISEGAAVVCLDILRASSTVCAALVNRASCVKPVQSIEDAEKAFLEFNNKGPALKCGERNGFKPDGFHLGNSPLEYSESAVKGKTIVLTTTNGTKIFGAYEDAAISLAGAFSNISLLCDFLSTIYNKYDSILLACAGSYGQVSYEDLICAGMFAKKLTGHFSELELSDSARAALSLFEFHEKNWKSHIKKTSHAKYLIQKGFEEDVNLCLKLDFFPVVPIIKDRTISKYG